MSTHTMRTVREDWMNDLLAGSGYIVSGHQSFADSLQLPKGTKASIRHCRLTTSEFPDVILLTIHCEDEKLNITAIRNTDTYDRINKLFSMVQTLIIRPGQLPFAINDTNFVGDDVLCHWFKGINAGFINDLGGVKKMNVSSNDSFVDWTRTYLTRNCIINDIDALLLPAEVTQSGILVELKRPRGDLAKWGPYINDKGNYESCSLIASRLKLQNRTIAFNIDKQNIVRLHIDVTWDDECRCLKSEFAFLEPKSAVAPQLDSNILWHTHKSTLSTTRF